jgi:hypothetical protein
MFLTSVRRVIVAASAMGAIWATSACAGDVGTQPSRPPRGFSIELAFGEQVTIPEESLTVSIVNVEDSRCPADAVCFWAGHASVTLQVSKAGLGTELLTIGTQVPRSMDLPADAKYGVYLFSLVSLDPVPSVKGASPTTGYRAIVKVSKQ